MNRKLLQLIGIALVAFLVLDADLFGQRRGPRGGGARGGSGRGVGGRTSGPTTPGGPPPSRGDDDGGSGTGVPAGPERLDRQRLQWVIVAPEDAAVEGTSEDADPLAKLLESKTRPGIPTIVFVHDTSEKSSTLEETVFKNERVALGALFFTNLRLSLIPPIPPEQAKKITGGKGAAIILYDGERKEIKRFQGHSTTASSVYGAMPQPVKKAYDLSLVAFVQQEEKILLELDKAYESIAQMRDEMDDLAASSTNPSVQKKMDEIARKMADVNDQIRLLQEKERSHIAIALRR